MRTRRAPVVSGRTWVVGRRRDVLHGVWAIGLVRERRGSRRAERTRPPGEGSGAGRDDHMETVRRGRGAGERHAVHARTRHRHRGRADPALDLGRGVVLGRGDPRPRSGVLRVLFAGAGHLTRDRVGHVVRRRDRQPRAQLRRPVGRAHPGRGRDRLGGRGARRPGSRTASCANARIGWRTHSPRSACRRSTRSASSCHPRRRPSWP